jgi:hypothetical protein
MGIGVVTGMEERLHAKSNCLRVQRGVWGVDSA